MSEELLHDAVCLADVSQTASRFACGVVHHDN